MNSLQRHVTLGAAVVGLVMSVVSSGELQAQGALSTQGFGYPPGGLSTRALGTAGATGEFDLLSARNPAAVAELGNSIISIQGEPEFRTMRFGDVREDSRVQRVPLIAAGLRVKRVGILISGTTLLDRSFSTESPSSASIDGTSVPTLDRLDSRGAMTELRLAGGWRWKSFGLGAAVVAVTGEHSVARSRIFPDTLRFGGVLDSTRLGFGGIGAAFGMNWRASPDLLVGASLKVGGGLNALRNDSTLRSARVPSRLGAGVLYRGFAGTILAVNVERVQWSAMNGLGTEAATAQDATNWSAGTEFEFGTLRRFPVLWRLGYGQRDLPFLLRDLPVSERAIHGGLGVPVAGESASLDLSVQRSLRRVQGDQVREDAWGLSAAITIRP